MASTDARGGKLKSKCSYKASTSFSLDEGFEVRSDTIPGPEMSISDNLIRFAELQGSESDISRFFEGGTSSDLSSVYPVDNEEIHLSIASSISAAGRVDDRDEIDVESEAMRDRRDETKDFKSKHKLYDNYSAT